MLTPYVLFDVLKIIFYWWVLLKFIVDVLYSATVPSANYYVYYAIFHFHKDTTEFHKYVEPSFN